MPDNAYQIILDPHVTVALVCIGAAIMVAFVAWVLNMADAEKKRGRDRN
jgi:hypothetical protein